MNNAQTQKASAMLWLMWLTVLAFGAAKNTEKPKLLSRLDTPPVFVRNDKDDSKWPQIIREGVNEARKYFGNYGPVYVYIIGHEDSELNSDEFHRRIVDEYCKRRHAPTNDRIDKCKNREGAKLVKQALSGRGDAYLSLVDYTEPPVAELVFINPHKFRDPYLYTRGIHEYTHVFQRSFPETPTWMMEGGAEFFACYLGEKRGWSDLSREMTKFMQNVNRIEDPELGIQDMEDVDKAAPEIKKYYRHLAYDAGAWAFAFMIHRSTSRSIAGVLRSFYPLLAEKGWEVALVEHVNMDDKEAFYEAFGEFLKQPLNMQLKMLETLKD